MIDNRGNKKEKAQEESFPKVHINWYPGHMLKTKKQIIEDLKLIDIVIEILDARIPVSSRNPDIQRIIKNKKEIIILNKSDLAEEHQNKKWIEEFKRNGIVAICTDSNLGKGTKEFLNEVEKVLDDEIEKATQKGRVKKNIRIMIVGIPNVGKSSFINRICNKKTAEVGNRPGVTKQKQWVRIANNVELLDTPGVLWPKFEDEKVALNLSYVGSIKDEILDETNIAYNLLTYLYKNYIENIFTRYEISDKDIEGNKYYEEDEIYNLMKIIGKKRGAIITGGEIDDEKTSKIILNDFRSGKLGKITLEKLDG